MVMELCDNELYCVYEKANAEREENKRTSPYDVKQSTHDTTYLRSFEIGIGKKFKVKLPARNQYWVSRIRTEKVVRSRK